MIRQHVQAFLTAPPEPSKNQTAKEVKEKQVMARANLFKQNLMYLPEQAVRHRKSYFIGKVGTLHIVSRMDSCLWWGALRGRHQPLCPCRARRV